MSKSKGNVADPLKAMDKYGVDSVRWYLMRAGGSLSDDAGMSFSLNLLLPSGEHLPHLLRSWTSVIKFCIRPSNLVFANLCILDYSERELANNHKLLRFQLGNLLNRISSPTMIPKIGDFRPELTDAEDGPLDTALKGLRDMVEQRMEGYEVHRACEGIMEVVMMVCHSGLSIYITTGPPPQGQPHFIYVFMILLEALPLSQKLTHMHRPINASQLSSHGNS